MEQSKGDKRFYFGISLICIGAVLILEKLNLIPESLSDIIISFPMLLIAIGTFSYIGGNRKASLILIAVGTIFLLPRFLDDETVRSLRRIMLPLTLIALGAVVILRQRLHKPISKLSENGPIYSKDQIADTFDDFVIFGGREIFITSQNFLGGKATAIFGGMDFDLRKAQLSRYGAVIDCVSVFGGCGFKIPMDWNVRNELTTLFGAFTDKRGDTFNERYYDPSKTIVIKGVSIFGGVEIKHF